MSTLDAGYWFEGRIVVQACFDVVASLSSKRER